MIQVLDGKVTQTTLPQTGRLADGRSVSNYDKLPVEILKAEGWMPLIGEKPTAKEGQKVVFDGYTINKDSVTAVYRIEDIPVYEPTPEEIAAQEKEVLIQAKIREIAEAELVREGKLTAETK